MSQDLQLWPLEIVEERTMSPETDAAIRRLLCECFPADEAVFSATRYWHGTVPSYSVVCREGEEVVGHVGGVLRRIRAGREEIGVAGILNVAVSPRFRKKGLSRQLMEEGMREAARRRVSFGLLFCLPALERFYASLGWRTRVVRVTMEDPVRGVTDLPKKNITMVRWGNSRPFPEGGIHLAGTDW